MPRSAVDERGNTYSRLTVVERSGLSAARATWLCRCVCGASPVVRGDLLRSGMVRSCGCLAREVQAVSAKANGQRNRTHGDTLSPEYHTWASMLTRCYTPSSTSYRWYGALGVQVCPEWRADYEAFLEDMGRRPSLTHSIDRINPAGNYEPSNCRWATRKEQATNKRHSGREHFKKRTA